LKNQTPQRSQLRDLEGIEKTVRQQVLEYVGPNIALFLLKKDRNTSRQTSKNQQFGRRTKINN
jgi:hypothetical protein